jgi:hypothetical protein
MSPGTTGLVGGRPTDASDPLFVPGAPAEVR